MIAKIPTAPKKASYIAGITRELLELESFTQAEHFARQCLAIREKAIPDDWSLFNTKAMLGGALLGQKKYTEAEPLLVAGYEGMKAREESIPAQGKIRVTESLERLVALYEQRNAEGDTASAAKYKKLLEARQQESQIQPQP
jgi:hypothetical protein